MIFGIPRSPRRTDEFDGRLTEPDPLKQPPEELVLFADGLLKYVSNLA
jgi:hypothetical protein